MLDRTNQITEQLARRGITARDVRLQIAIAEYQNNGGTFEQAESLLRAAYTNAAKGQHVLADDSWAYVAPTINRGVTAREWQQHYPSLRHAVSAASQDILIAAGLLRNKQVRARLMLHCDTLNGIAHALDPYSPSPPSAPEDPTHA